MHILNLTEDVSLAPGFFLKADEYLVDDLSGAQLAARAGGAEMRFVEDITGAARNRADRDSLESVLFFRTGGFGDLVLLTPVLRRHKELYPNARIGVCCVESYGEALEGLPYVDEIVPYPASTEVAARWDRWVFLERAIERNPDAKKMHMTDIFAKMSGIELTDKKADYRVSASEAVWANVQYPRTEKPRVAIQFSASARCRTYPRVGDIAGRMMKRGWEVFLMGAPGEIQIPPQHMHENLRNLSANGTTFRQSCAVINSADVVIGPDSALVHVAGALGVPCVALYGPFPWQLRTAYAPTTEAISGVGECAPCFHHYNPAGGPAAHFPAGCPSAATGWCRVLAEIKPERIAARAELIARNLRATGGTDGVVPFVRGGS